MVSPSRTLTRTGHQLCLPFFLPCHLPPSPAPIPNGKEKAPNEKASNLLPPHQSISLQCTEPFLTLSYNKGSLRSKAGLPVSLIFLVLHPRDLDTLISTSLLLFILLFANSHPLLTMFKSLPFFKSLLPSDLPLESYYLQNSYLIMVAFLTSTQFLSLDNTILSSSKRTQVLPGSSKDASQALLAESDTAIAPHFLNMLHVASMTPHSFGLFIIYSVIP